MGIFTRFKDIVSSNISAMLDKAEDPEKMIRLMINEMEETLVELKAACAGYMAGRTKLGRDLDSVENSESLWHRRAELAVEKGREDLAREAILEKHRVGRKVEALKDEQDRFEELVSQARSDIAVLEEKLESARERQRSLIERHRHARRRMRARTEARNADSSDVIMRFDRFEQRVERMEAEASLVDRPDRTGLEEEFELLEKDVDVDKELDKLRKNGK